MVKEVIDAVKLRVLIGLSKNGFRGIYICKHGVTIRIGRKDGMARYVERYSVDAPCDYTSFAELVVNSRDALIERNEERRTSLAVNRVSKGFALSKQIGVTQSNILCRKHPSTNSTHYCSQLKWTDDNNKEHIRIFSRTPVYSADILGMSKLCINNPNNNWRRLTSSQSMMFDRYVKDQNTRSMLLKRLTTQELTNDNENQCL